MFFGPQVFILYFMLLGGGRADVLSIVDAEHYFANRNINVKGDLLIRLAGRPHDGPKEEIARLLALRTIGENKDVSARATLEEVVRKEKGFIREYAETALARIDGKEPAITFDKDSVRKDALSWFPADSAVFGAFAPGAVGGVSEKQMRDVINKMIPAEGRGEMYDFVEQTGNLRLERFAMAYNPGERNQGGGRFLVRLTGKCDRKRLVEAMKKADPNATTTEDGDILHLNFGGGFLPAMAFVGDTDFVVGGLDGGFGGNANHRAALDALLAVRAGKKPSVLKGVFGKDLAAVTESAFGVVVASVFEEMRKELLRSPAGVAPNNFLIEAAVVDKTIRLKGRAEFASPEDAKAGIEGGGRLKKAAMEELEKEANRLKPELVKMVKTMLDSLTFATDGNAVKAEMTVPHELPKALMEYWMSEFAGAFGN